MLIHNSIYPWDIVKSKILIKVTKLKKVELEGKISLKAVDNKTIKMSGKEFKKDLTADTLAGNKLTVEIVNEAPTQFQINAIYILANGQKAWIFVKDNEN